MARGRGPDPDLLLIVLSLLSGRPYITRPSHYDRYRNTQRALSNFTLSSPSLTMSKPIKTCVLGVGLGGLVFHVPFVLILPQYFTLHAVMERNPASPPHGKAHERFHGKGSIDMRNVKIHRTLDAVLGDPEVELVVITTPNETHYSLAKAALEAGKHGTSEIFDTMPKWDSYHGLVA